MHRGRDRRVSLPAVSASAPLPLRQQSALSEARGLIHEMLALNDLPPHLASSLRAVNQLLTSSHSTNDASHLLPSVAEDPITGETIIVQQKQNLSYRIAPLIWSTVTSATGLPTVEPQPCRNRSSSRTYKNKENADSALKRDSLTDENEDVVRLSSVSFDCPAIECDPLLNNISVWDFPIFELEKRFPKTILSQLCYRVFHQHNLFRIFRIQRRRFFSFMHALECGYWDIPYHNRSHAADVLQACFYFVTSRIPPLTSDTDETIDQLCQALPSLELLAIFTAAAMHDYDHPGKTNAFLVATRDPKAIMYNDRSVLENHHAAASWRLLQRPEHNWLSCLDDSEYKRFRYILIEIILSTDLKRHFDVLAEFNAKIATPEGLDWSNESDRLLVSQMVVKMADINSPTRVYQSHVTWTEKIVEEFYVQGDEEKKRGLPVSAYMDRHNPQVAKLQDSFIAHLVSPLVEALTDAELLPREEDCDPELLENLRSNHERWLKEIESQKSDKLGMIEETEGDEEV